MPKRPEPEPSSGLSSEEIFTIVNDIRSIGGSPKDRERTASKRYPEFQQNYPFLFDMVCSATFDYTRFEYMMNLKASVDQAKLTQEQAAIKVGQDLFDVYVKDKLPKNGSDGAGGGASGSV